MSSRTSTAASATSHTLRFPQFDREIVAEPEETIYQCARRAGLRIVGACGGRGNCGTCTIQLIEGRVQHANGRILAPLQRREGRAASARWIRACQVSARTDCTIEVEPRSLAPIVRADVDMGGIVTCASKEW
jgi:ferredoxin